MASTKELRDKIQSLKNTSKITSAMKLVSSAKLKKSQDAWNLSRAYAGAMRDFSSRILQSLGSTEYPLLRTRPVRKVTVLVLATDKGLCGSFNTNLLRMVQARIGAEWQDYAVDFVVVGKKGTDFLTRRFPRIPLQSHPAPSAKVPYGMARTLANQLIEYYVQHKTDQVFIAYNRFQSLIHQEAIIAPLLPVPPRVDNKIPPGDLICEPTPTDVLVQVLFQQIHATVHFAMQSNALGEQAARMNAMDNATRNSKELIQRYTLKMNRVRQTAITTELSEIVAGAESLKT